MKELGKENGLDKYSFDPIKITFVGARGTGKTSLMTSMYNELRKSGVADFSVAMDTSRILQEMYVDMLQMIEGTSMFDVVEKPGIRGSDDMEKYTFVGRALLNNKLFEFPFEFTDMPGGWYTEGTQHEDEVKNVLANSSASFLMVSAPALDAGGYVHQNENRTMAVGDWYKNNKAALAANGHTVILVLCKAERFIEDPTKCDKLFNKVQNEYGPLVRELRDAGIQVVCTWVETLGGVQFFKYDKKNGVQMDKYIRTGDYKPKNCVVPLILALRHGMTKIEGDLANEMTKFSNRIANFFLALFGGMTAVQAAHACADNMLKVLTDKVESDESKTTFTIV